MHADSRNLPYGVHFGASDVRTEVPGFSVSLLAPTLRAEDVPLHTHQSASFVFVLTGSYYSAADRAAPVCSVPTLIFNPAGTTHRDSFLVPTGRFLAVSVSDQSLRVAGAALPVAAQAFAAGDGVTASLRIVQHCLAPRIENDATIENLCWELLSSATGAELWPNEGRTPIPSWVSKARELLHDRCSGPLHMTEMAFELGVHPVYFARAFRRMFRCSPGEYRMRCRLRKAMALLQNPGLLLSDIALASGFFDQSHFNRAFREHFGIAPHAYRRCLHGDAPVPRFNSSKIQRNDPEDTGIWSRSN